MVDKINGNSSYDFPRSQKRKNKNPAVRAYENTPDEKDAARRRAAGISAKNSQDLLDHKESGVILDLSGKAADRKKPRVVSRKKDVSWKDALRRFAAPVVRWLKDFWNSDNSGKGQSGPDTDSDPELMQLDFDPELMSMQSDESLEPLQPESAESTQGQEEIHEQQLKALADQAVKSGDLHQIERFLTQNGTKRLAHNSDLLTYYDRRGKFVEMDETEKHRVLFGDKNVLKL